ncbi:hypothetical protein CP982_20640 [Streptomyces spectabilis]|uniref:Uncharacterized protein n=1 Tax=Streptomyces spectabilis TaxID=68270 RepID=A0A5P2XBY5_STRST|nr:hypothetical protein CP982_20640 [Streptomyces spectabilis]
MRSLFQEAADAGRSRADVPPVSAVVRRGRRAHRVFVTAVAVAASLVVAGAGALALSYSSEPTPPATVPSGPQSPSPPLSPSPSPSPPPTDSGSPPPPSASFPPTETSGTETQLGEAERSAPPTYPPESTGTLGTALTPRG